MSIWDDPELQAGGEFVSFDKPGDTVSGTIQAIRTHRFDDGKVVPQILLTTDDGEERTVTAGQVRLKAELAEQRPEAGDHLKITLTQIEKRSGGKTLKHFDVQVSRGGKPQAAPVVPATPATPAAASQPTVDVQAAAAALAALTPEQKAALGIAS